MKKIITVFIFIIGLSPFLTAQTIYVEGYVDILHLSTDCNNDCIGSADPNIHTRIRTSGHAWSSEWVNNNTDIGCITQFSSNPAHYTQAGVAVTESWQVDIWGVEVDGFVCGADDGACTSYAATPSGDAGVIIQNYAPACNGTFTQYIATRTCSSDGTTQTYTSGSQLRYYWEAASMTAANSGGTLTPPAAINICPGDDPGAILGSSVNSDRFSSRQWSVSVNGGLFTTIAGATGQDFDPAASDVPLVGGVTTTYTFRRTLTYCTSFLGATTSFNATNDVTITVTPPSASASNDGPYCTDATIQLHATGGGTYSWSGPNGFSDVSQDPTRAASSNGGTYSVTVTNAGGCTASATTTVTVNGTTAPSNVLATAAPSSVCPGDNVSLSGSANGATSYAWSSTPSGFNSLLQNPVTTPIVNTTYTISANNACGTTTATVSVNVVPIQAVISGGTSFCTGGNTTLTANQGVAGFNYQWDDVANSNTQSITVSTPATYSVTATGGGCSASASAQVTELSTPVIALNSSYTSCCQNIVLNSTPDSTWTYHWSDNSITGSIMIPGGTTVENQLYSVTATNSSGCTSTASTTVSIFCINPTATAVPPTIISGQTNTINVTTGYGAPTDFNYIWTPTANLSDSTSSTAISNATATTTYTILVSDPVAGCVDSVDITLTSLPTSAMPFAMPSAFSPNGDHINDVYYPVLPSNFGTVTEFRIYNRWGELVHNNPLLGWDGKYKGQDQPVDSYSYFVVVHSIDLNNPSQMKDYKKEGSFTLLR